PRCSRSRRRTGPTRGCARTPTPTRLPTASPRFCSTACAATRVADLVPTGVLVVNPFASRVTQAKLAAVERELARAVELTVVLTERPGHATELVADSCRGGCDAVVVFSGDGGFNEALNGLGADVPIGF